MDEQIPEEVKRIAKKIGNFYYHKNQKDIVKTNLDLDRLGIQKIEFVGADLMIHTCRPGILIGVRGQNITELEKHLGLKIRIYEVKDHIRYWLHPEVEYSEDE